jgi:tRNA (cytidine/uridine-2'-O-)-methyltransferase
LSIAAGRGKRSQVEANSGAVRSLATPCLRSVFEAKAGAVERDRPELTLALYEPDIAANAGAMLRTCACLGVAAAIIEPAGFVFSNSKFRRAGMDYLDAVRLARHSSFAAFEAWRAREGRRLVLLTTHGAVDLLDFSFAAGDVLMVGRESAGVPDLVHAIAGARVRVPIQPPMRSLNVGVAAAIALFEALRQLG